MKKASNNVENLVNLKALLYLMGNDKQSKIDEDKIYEKITVEEKPFQINIKPDINVINISNSAGGRTE